jgi:IS605 OrfB family transposase
VTFKSKKQRESDKEKNQDTYISTTTQHVRLSELGKDVIFSILRHANSLYNSMVFSLKQGYFTFKTLNFQSIACDLQEDFKDNYHYKMLHSQAAQSVCHKVAENFKSFKEVLDRHYVEGGKRPNLPGYRKKGGLFEITYPKQTVKIEVEKSVKYAYVSTGINFRRTCFADVMGTKLNEYLKFRVPDFVDTSTLVELTITTKHSEVYIHWICRKTNPQISSLDDNKVLGIDVGLNNFATCIPNTGEKGFIINGKQLKSINQFYNKSVAKLKTGKEQGFWNGSLARLTLSRNNQVKDFIKKSARVIINKCLALGIGKIIFGWNQGIKDGIDIGKRNTQSFVQVPFNELKNTLEYLCKRYGIQFVVVEESYTSKMSFFDGDELPVYGQDTDCQKLKSSGRRTKRGEFKTKNKIIINADANGACNILKKSKIDTSKIIVRVCQVIEKINIWVGKRPTNDKSKSTIISNANNTAIGTTEPVL